MGCTINVFVALVGYGVTTMGALRPWSKNAAIVIPSIKSKKLGVCSTTNKGGSAMTWKEKQAEKMARWLKDDLAKGVARSKRTIRLAGQARLWACSDDEHILVGYHGRGNPVVVLER